MNKKYFQWVKENWILVIIIVFILGGVFYWYEWRPAQIKAECSDKYLVEKHGIAGRALSKVSDDPEKREQDYESCLRANGLDPK